MRTDIEQYELIEQILSDLVFALKVAKNRLMHQIVFERSLVDMKEQLSKIHNTHTSGSSGNAIWKTIIFSLLIFFLAAILVFFLITHDNHKNSANLPQMQRNNPEQFNRVITNEVIASVHPHSVIASQSNDYVREKAAGEDDSTVISLNIKEAGQIITVNSQSPVLHPKSSEEKITNALAGEVKTVNPVSDPCTGMTISGVIEAENSCDNAATGQISVTGQSVIGGEPPYQISIDGGKNYYSGFTVKNLLPSKYQVIIKDATDCTANLGEIVIEMVDCSFEYVFSPEKGEIWEIPEIQSSGDIKIYSKQGVLVFSQNFDLPGKYEWDGNSGSGHALPMGAYMFVLTKPESEIIRGTVTIVR
jgi:hypothetical protein